MPDPAHDPTPDPDASQPAPVAGRGRPFAPMGLRRMKTSWILKACAVAAFMGYGGLIALLLAGKLRFGTAGTVAFLSLASWFFLLWWYPVLERTKRRLGEDPGRAAIGTVLEWIAVSCVVLVHVLMAIIVVYSART